MDSLIDNMLICEISMNWDGMKNSVFCYKDLDGPASLGPVWDFDWAYGNINMYGYNTNFTEGWHTTNNYFTNEQYYQSESWNRYLIRDPYFLMKLYEKYKAVRNNEIADFLKAPEAYREILKADGNANDERWGYTYNNKKYYYKANSEYYDDAYNSLEKFMNKRISWIDSQFTSLDNLIESFGAYKRTMK